MRDGGLSGACLVVASVLLCLTNAPLFATGGGHDRTYGGGGTNDSYRSDGRRLKVCYRNQVQELNSFRLTLFTE